MIASQSQEATMQTLPYASRNPAAALDIVIDTIMLPLRISFWILICVLKAAAKVGG